MVPEQRMTDTPVTIADYEDRIIAFVDILGFRDMLTEMDRSPEIFSTVKSALYSVMYEELAVRYGEDDPDAFKSTYDILDPDQEAADSDTTGAQMTAFSDCFLISEKIERLPYLIARVHRLAFRLLLKGIVTRGGIVRGRIHHDARVAFGPGLVEAYRRETTVALYPRIVVDSDVASTFQSIEADRLDHASLISHGGRSLLARDIDGSWFINPFVIVIERVKNLGFGAYTPLWERYFQRVRDQLVGRLQFELDRGEPAFIAKIRWLVYHFNENLRGFPGKVPPIDTDQPK
jgi:hypothetical protein